MPSFPRFLAFVASAFIALPALADFRFVHMSDTHFGATLEPAGRSDFNAKMFREISSLDPKPAFAVNTGDVVEVGTPAEYEVYRKVVPNLTLPLHNAPGNHDVRWNPLGKEGYTLGVKGPLYHSWDHENVHFVTLDSTVLLQHWGHFGQEQLDWLAEDLKKIGTEKPVVIAFHHWIARDSVQVDNERKLLETVAPYNVVLWLIGHGHSDIQWSINGVPAIMTKGLYQGSYYLIDVTKEQMRVRRRILGQPNQLLGEKSNENALPHTIQDVMTVPLKRQPKPQWEARAKVVGNALQVVASSTQLPPDTKLEYRINATKEKPLPRTGDSSGAEVPASDLLPGKHLVTVQATLPDGRAYQSVSDILIERPDSVRAAWETDLAGAVQSRLVRHGDALYVSTMRGDLFSLNPTTGRPNWKFSAEGPIFSTPIVSDGSVYVGSGDHHVYAIDAKTGKPKWKAKTGGAVFGSAAVTKVTQAGESKEVVCIASVDRKIYGLDARTGSVMWTAQGEGMYQSQAATDGVRFFVGGWDQHLRAIDAATGQQVWTRKFGRSFYYSPAISSPSVADGMVYVTSNDGVFHAVRCDTGEVAWEFDGKKVGYSSPLLHDGRAYVAIGDTGTVFCFDARTGSKVWESNAPSVVYDSSFAHAGGKVFIGTVSGTLCAFDAKDGKPAWQYSLGPGHLLASPATDDELVYISSMNGRVTALPLR